MLGNILKNVDYAAENKIKHEIKVEAVSITAFRNPVMIKF